MRVALTVDRESAHIFGRLSLLSINYNPRGQQSDHSGVGASHPLLQEPTYPGRRELSRRRMWKPGRLGKWELFGHCLWETLRVSDASAWHEL
jgi:hypothetical protein